PSLARTGPAAARLALRLGGRSPGGAARRGGGAAGRLRAGVRGEEGLVRGCLERIRGVGAVTRTAPPRADTCAFLLDVDSPSVAEGVAAALVGGGFGLAELREHSVDLEALFLELTGSAPASVRATDAA